MSVAGGFSLSFLLEFALQCSRAGSSVDVGSCNELFRGNIHTDIREGVANVTEGGLHSL